MKGIIIKELYISRKKFCIIIATYFVLMLMWILIRMSCLYGNIGKYAGDGAKDVSETTYYFAVFGMLAVIVGCVINNLNADIMSRWCVFQKTLPMTSKQLVGAAYLTNAVTISVSTLIHLIMTLVLSAVFGISFQVYYLGVFAAFAVVLFFGNAVAMYPYYRSRNIKKGKFVNVALMCIIYFGAYLATYFYAASIGQKAHDEICQMAEKMNVKVSQLPVTEDSLAEEYMISDLAKVKDTLINSWWLFLIAAAGLIVVVFFMSAKAMDRPMDEMKPAKKDEKGAEN